jgi:ABC-type molybdenum transport system ATPase subunit/photorepair protein PhrA
MNAIEAGTCGRSTGATAGASSCDAEERIPVADADAGFAARRVVRGAEGRQLRRGRRRSFGIVGRNGSGKSTMLS